MGTPADLSLAVFRRLCRHQPNTAIARQLGCGVTTVRLWRIAIGEPAFTPPGIRASHPGQEQVIAALQAVPWQTVRDLQAATGYTKGWIYAVLRRLRQRGLLLRATPGRYALCGTPPPQEPRHAAL